MFNSEANMHIQGPQINQFNNVQVEPIPRSAFRRDFGRRTTFDVDFLIPCFVDEILPGDEVSLNMTALARLSTPIKPLMDNLYLDTFFFFVPNRLVWDNWEKFQGQQTQPGDSTDYTIPYVAYNTGTGPLATVGMPVGSQWDYFGLPTDVSQIQDVSALYFRAYALIYNEWFRDENLQNSITIPTGDGPDESLPLISCFKRGKRKDYVTSCLPWPQKGDAVSIPLGASAPVVSNGLSPRIQQLNTPGNYGTLGWNTASGVDRVTLVAPSAGTVAPGAVAFGSETGLFTDLAAAEPITINALRQAALYQQILELDARAGTRYVESIYSRFGVISPDFRLQRPELIGLGTTRINVYAVPQTAPSGESTPQGNLAGFGTAQITGGHGCRYAATEHGMILGIMCVRADLAYQQAVPRMFTRRTRLDFYEPLLNGLGEQAVLRREVAAFGEEEDLEVFGYQERFSEYRYKTSEVTGKFRSSADGTLDIWHLAQSFTFPTLNDGFIVSNTPIARTLAVPSEPHFLADLFFHYNHVRPMPIRSNPGIDRL